MAEPILELGDSVELDENASGEPVLRHTPSGAEFHYDSSNDAWMPSAGLGSDANKVPASVFESVNTGYVNIDNQRRDSDWLVFDDGGTVKAVDVDMGATVHSDSDLGNVVNSILADDDNPHIHIIGPITYSTKIHAEGTEARITSQREDFSENNNASGYSLKYTGTGPAIHFEALSTDGNRSIAIENIHVAADGSGTHVIFIDSTSNSTERVRLDGVTASGAGSDGIRVEGNVFDLYMGDIRAHQNGADGVNILKGSGGRGVGQYTIGHVSANSNTNRGVNIEGGDGGSINFLYGGGADIGVRIRNHQRFSADTIMGEGNTTHNVSIDASKRGSIDTIYARDGGITTGTSVDFLNNNNALTIGSIIQEGSSSSDGILFDSLNESEIDVVKLEGSIGFLGARDVDVHQGMDFNNFRNQTPTTGSLSISFQSGTKYSNKPNLDVATESEASWWVSSWSTNASGQYTGVTLSFVDNSGAAVNPTTHVNVSPSR